MSGLPKSGNGLYWLVTMPRLAARLRKRAHIDVSALGRLLDGTHRLGAACELVAEEPLRALAALGRLCCFMVREASFCYCYQQRALSPLPGIERDFVGFGIIVDHGITSALS